MNIALLTTTLEGGGAARVLAHMANHWAEAGAAVTLVSFEDGTSPSFYPLHPGVRVKYLSLNRFSPNIYASLRNNWRRLVAIRRALLEARPCAVISFIDTANVRTILALLGAGVPVIVSERVHPAHEQIGGVWRLARRLTYPLAACVVAQTTQIAEHLRKAWGLRKVRVIANPVLPLAPRGTAPPLPPKTLLAVGRLYPQKAYPLLLGAFSRIKDAVPDWTLTIVGTGPQRDELRQLADSMDMQDRVKFLGHVQDIAGLLAQAQAYVMSSAYEGFPNALCEAMAAGLPCVSTDCPSGPAEVLRHGENGLLTPCGDEAALAETLRRLLTDEPLRLRLGREAIKISDRFSIGSIMHQWEQAITHCSPAWREDKP